MKKLTCYIVLLLGFTNLYAQSFDEVFEKFSKIKKTETDFQVNLDFKLYKGVKGTKVYEDYSGIMAVKKDVKYQQIGAMKHITFLQGFVKLNTEEKAMVVGLSSEKVNPSLEEIDPDLIYKYYDKGTLEVLNGIYKISFNAKENSSIPTSRLEIFIDSENYRQTRAVIYYATLKDFSSYDKDRLNNKTDALVDFPRLEISYYDFSKKIKIDSRFLLQETYIKVSSTKIEGVNQYKDYEIILAQ